MLRTSTKDTLPPKCTLYCSTTAALLPDDASVVLLGDGEFDSIELQTFVATVGWEYVCRTAKNTQVYHDGAWMSLDDCEPWPDSCSALHDVLFTRQAYGPVMVILW